MNEPSPPRPTWLLALPLTPVLTGAPAAGAALAYVADGPPVLGALGAWLLAATLSTAVLAQRGGWSHAIGIVGVATALGVGGVIVISAIGAAIIFGLIVAICGVGR